jgi:hypothetical protein
MITKRMNIDGGTTEGEIIKRGINVRIQTRHKNKSTIITACNVLFYPEE